MSRAIFTYGRFNPPTMGHDVLINKLKSIAGGDAVFVFASQSNDPSRNPFDYKTKTKYMKKAFQGVTVVDSPKIKNMFDAIEMLGKKHDEVVMVVGGDRLASIKRSVPASAKRMGINLKVVSAGAIDPDAEGAKGMSASKMRAAAARDDYDAFRLGCPKSLSKKDCLQMFKELKKVMNVKESLEENWFDYGEFEMFCERVVSLAQRRAIGRRMKRLAPKLARIRKRKAKFRKGQDSLERIARKKAKLTLRQRLLGGKKFQDLSIGARVALDKQLQKRSKAVDKLSKKLLPKIKVAERERLQKLRNPAPQSSQQDEEFIGECWKTHVQRGYKMKGGKRVPNCVPRNESKQLLREPEILDRLVKQLMDKGMDKNKAYAIATSSLQKRGVLKKGTQQLTSKGEGRNSMSAAERAKDRAAKRSGKRVSDYKYNNRTNIATLKDK